MPYPKDLERLISYYQKLPGIGPKSAERLALATIEFQDAEIEDYSDALKQAKKNLTRCTICGHLTDKEICDICADETRNQNLICLVEDYRNIFAFERSGKYHGVYHVLNGLISPMDDIGPEDINLPSLLTRLDKLDNPELIMALKPTVEGQATTLYIKKRLENKKVLITRLSYGIPIGAELDYLDNITIEKALEDRKQISDD